MKTLVYLWSVIVLASNSDLKAVDRKPTVVERDIDKELDDVIKNLTKEEILDMAIEAETPTLNTKPLPKVEHKK